MVWIVFIIFVGIKLQTMTTLNINENIDFDQLLVVIKQLSPADKIKLNEFMWQENFEIPIEHQKLVLERIEKSKFDTKRMLDWEEASKTLKS